MTARQFAQYVAAGLVGIVVLCGATLTIALLFRDDDDD
jgi:hypothetical protein